MSYYLHDSLTLTVIRILEGSSLFTSLTSCFEKNHVRKLDDKKETFDVKKNIFLKSPDKGNLGVGWVHLLQADNKCIPWLLFKSPPIITELPTLGLV